jgi:hypothetical protein
MTDQPNAADGIQEALESVARDLKEAVEEADDALDELNRTIRRYNQTLVSAREWLTEKGMTGLADGSDFSDLDEVVVDLPSESQEHADLFRDQLED